VSAFEYVLLSIISFSAMNGVPKPVGQFMCLLIGFYFAFRAGWKAWQWMEENAK